MPEPEPREALHGDARFRRFAPFVAAFARRLGFRGDDVEDVVQETFLVAHRSGGYRPGPATPTTWLAAIALRVGSSARRKGYREIPGDGADTMPDPSPLADDAMESRQLRHRLEQALDRIPVERRAVLILFEIDGEPCESIAAALGVPLGTVHSRLHTARRELREAFVKLALPYSRRRSEER
jgi:RNA polymerase sigma-70 factor (ECF subfamily)